MMINNNYIVFTCFYPHQTPKKMMLTNPESGHLSYCSIDHCGTAGECAKCSWIVPKTSAGLDSPSYSRWMYTKAWLTSWQIRPLWREWFDKTVVGCLCREFHPVCGDLTSLDLWPCDPKSGKLCIPPGGNGSHISTAEDLCVMWTHLKKSLHCSVVSQLKKVGSQKF